MPLAPTKTTLATSRGPHYPPHISRVSTLCQEERLDQRRRLAQDGQTVRRGRRTSRQGESGPVRDRSLHLRNPLPAYLPFAAEEGNPRATSPKNGLFMSLNFRMSPGGRMIRALHVASRFRVGKRWPAGRRCGSEHVVPSTAFVLTAWRRPGSGQKVRSRCLRLGGESGCGAGRRWALRWRRRRPKGLPAGWRIGSGRRAKSRWGTAERGRRA